MNTRHQCFFLMNDSFVAVGSSADESEPMCSKRMPTLKFRISLLMLESSYWTVERLGIMTIVGDVLDSLLRGAIGDESHFNANHGQEYQVATPT